MSDYVLEKKTVTLPLNGKDVVIQETDGYADRLILKRNKKMYELIVDYLAVLVQSIGSLRKITTDHILDLYIPDQDHLLIEGYKINYGEIFEFNNMCYVCGEISPHEFPLKSMKFTYPDVENKADPEIEIVLPKTKKKIVFGLLTGHKEAIVLSQLDTGVDSNQSEFQSIRTIDGSNDFSYEDVVRFPSADHRAIRKARNKLVCGYDSVAKLVCPKCSSPALVNVLTHPDFLFPTG